MRELLKNFGFFVYLVNFVGWFKGLWNVDGFDCDDLTSLFMKCFKYFTEAALSKQLVHLVLVDDLGHVEGLTKWFQVQLVPILNEVNIIVLD